MSGLGGADNYYLLNNIGENYTGGIWFSCSMFNEHFYDEKETKNILRTKLIDRILYE